MESGRLAMEILDSMPAQKVSFAEECSTVSLRSGRLRRAVFSVRVISTKVVRACQSDFSLRLAFVQTVFVVWRALCLGVFIGNRLLEERLFFVDWVVLLII